MRLWLAIIVCLTVVSVGCEFRRDAVTVEYVLPDGFRGVAVVLTHSQDASSPSVRNGVVVLEFDEKGICRVPDGGPRTGWYRPQARYRSGRFLPVINNSISEEQHGGGLAVWENAALDGVGSTLLLVGYAEELDRIWPKVERALQRHKQLPDSFFPCRIDDDGGS